MAEEKVLETVRKLLDRAQHANTGSHEADACIRKADALMMKHAIDQAMLDASAKGETRTPVTKKFNAYSRDSEWAHLFGTVLHSMEEITRCRIAVHFNGDITVVGMSDDASYLETLWTTVYLEFVSKIEPRWNNDLGLDANVFFFKRAGFKWPEIHSLATRNGHSVPWPDGGALIRAAKRHAKVVGEELPKTQRHAAYRESFAEGFVRAVCTRMREQRLDNERMATTNGSGAELALVSVKDRVNEEFYTVFPGFRPMSDEEMAKYQAEQEEKERLKAEKHEAWLAAMSPAERRAYDAEQERKRRREAREDDRYWRQAAREQERSYDRDGMNAGRRAGESVNLGGRGATGSSSPKGEI